jgi:hypothetical protein
LEAAIKYQHCCKESMSVLSYISLSDKWQVISLFLTNC